MNIYILFIDRVYYMNIDIVSYLYSYNVKIII